MFRRIKLFFHAMKAVKAARSGADVDAEVSALLRKAGFDEADGFDESMGISPFDAAVEDLLLEPPFEQLYPDKPQLTQAHVALIRRMRLSWNGAEVGAPQCEPRRSFVGGTAPELVRAELGEISDEAVAEFMITLPAALRVFMATAKLEPGTYTLTNMSPELLDESKRGLEGAERLFAISDEMSMTVEEDDIALARELQWEWPYEDDMLMALEAGDIAGPTVDPKRPYGDMSYIDLDMHRILGWPVEKRNEDGYIQISEAQAEAATRLHFRQLGVCQAFLVHAEV